MKKFVHPLARTNDLNELKCTTEGSDSIDANSHRSPLSKELAQACVFNVKTASTEGGRCLRRLPLNFAKNAPNGQRFIAAYPPEQHRVGDLAPPTGKRLQSLELLQAFFRRP